MTDDGVKQITSILNQLLTAIPAAIAAAAAAGNSATGGQGGALGGGGGGAPPNVDVKVVNAIDSGDFVSQGLGTSVGQKAILNFMRDNAGAVKSAIGSN